MDNEEWIRLPPEGQKCPVTGIARTSLAEILKECDPQTGELCVLSLKKEKPGANRGIRLINKRSLLDRLQRSAEKQTGLVWAPHIRNPHGYSIEQVLKSQELFGYFLDPDCRFDDQDQNSLL